MPPGCAGVVRSRDACQKRPWTPRPLPFCHLVALPGMPGAAESCPLARNCGRYRGPQRGTPRPPYGRASSASGRVGRSVCLHGTGTSQGPTGRDLGNDGHHAVAPANGSGSHPASRRVRTVTPGRQATVAPAVPRTGAGLPRALFRDRPEPAVTPLPGTVSGAGVPRGRRCRASRPACRPARPPAAAAPPRPAPDRWRRPAARRRAAGRWWAAARSSSPHGRRG